MPHTPTTPTSRFGATGIAVTDLERSVDFYTRVVGMTSLLTLHLSYMDEVIVGFDAGRGASLALMRYTDGSEPSHRGTPVKLVFYVPDPKDLAARIRAEGCEVVREPEPVPELGDVVVGFARDHDGCLIEILQA